MIEDPHDVRFAAPLDGRGDGHTVEIDGTRLRKVRSVKIETDADGATLVTVAFYANVNTEGWP